MGLIKELEKPKASKHKHVDFLEDATNMLITHLFVLYKAFIGNQKLKRPEVVFHSTKDNSFITAPYKNSIAEIRYPADSKDKFTLHTFDIIFSLYENNFPALIFHEFAHIEHFTHAIEFFGFNDSFEYIRLYTEFSAMLIEMQKAMDFQSVDADKRVSLKDKIYIGMNNVERKTYTLSEYITGGKAYKEKIDNLFKQHNKYKSVKNLNFLYDALSVDAMFHLAGIHFLEKYCDDDYSKLVDASMFTDVFGSDILELAEMFKTEEVTKTLLMEARALELGMKEKFLAKYGG